MRTTRDSVHGRSPSGLRVVREEGRPNVKSGLLIEAKVVVQEEKQLLLHQVDFRAREDDGVGCPVLILRRRVVEVLGADNERGKEDAMLRRPIPLGRHRQLAAQPLQIDERREQGRNVYAGYAHERQDKVA